MVAYLDRTEPHHVMELGADGGEVRFGIPDSFRSNDPVAVVVGIGENLEYAFGRRLDIGVVLGQAQLIPAIQQAKHR